VEASVNSAPPQSHNIAAVSKAFYPHMAWWFEIKIVDWKDSMSAAGSFWSLKGYDIFIHHEAHEV
jgi:hypothetical protein